MTVLLSLGYSALVHLIIYFNYCYEYIYQMASFKVPRYFLFSDRLPMTVTGKVQKYKLRQMAEQRLQHGSSRFDINDG